ncbi:MAG TPA: AAA family ATPase [Ignisphaera sp.]|nr:AAA family ATPase [Ignisphaera sp.]
MDIDDVRSVYRELRKELDKAIIGYEEEKMVLFAVLLANGHVLLEGVPGIAKTSLVRALAKTFGLDEGIAMDLGDVFYRGFSRIQFTPDLMPSDITGSLVYNPATKSFEPRLGPVFAFIVLADEINRAVPRTQSALLQAMQEREVTIGSKTYPLEIRSKGKFFFVIATQNPIEQEGTYPLPEAQLDRFMVRLIMGYPKSLEEERKILELHAYRVSEPIEDIEKIVDPHWVVEAQEVIAKSVAVDEHVTNYAVKLIRATRPEIYESIARFFELGASPRAGIALIKLAKAYAALRGSSMVRIEDIDKVVFHVLNHRVIPNIGTIVERGSGFRARLEVIREGLEMAMKIARGV